MLRNRQSELDEAQRMIDELRAMVDKSETDHQSSLNDSFEQIDRAQIELSEVKLKEEALTFEKAELEIQVRELNDENHKLLDKVVELKEQLLKLTEEQAKKSQDDEAVSKLNQLQEDFNTVSRDYAQSEARIQELEKVKEAAELSVSEKEKELNIMIRKMEEADGDTIELREKLEELEIARSQSVDKVTGLEVENKNLAEQSSTLEAKAEQLTCELESIVKQLNAEKTEYEASLLEAQDKLKYFEEAQQLSLAENSATLSAQNTELQTLITELKFDVEREQEMNDKNRDLMNDMQAEVRDARKEKQKAITAQVEVEGRITIAQQQCDGRGRRGTPRRMCRVRTASRGRLCAAAMDPIVGRQRPVDTFDRGGRTRRWTRRVHLRSHWGCRLLCYLSR